jgi:hypothetical protein
MKSFPFPAAVICALAIFLVGASAQSPAPAAPRTTLQRLEEIRQKNKLLLEKQTETLKLLEQLQLQSQQLKAMGRRT